jgi:fructose-bisphosphate aldolase, class I
VALDFGRTHDKVYSELAKDHPIEWTRYQVANAYMGRAGLINSGGASSGKGDLEAVIRSAVINKRAGGMGMITGRKAFQKPMRDGVALLNAVQNVYLCEDVTVGGGGASRPVIGHWAPLAPSLARFARVIGHSSLAGDD